VSTCARGVSRSHEEFHVRTSNSTFARDETPRWNVEFHVRTWSSMRERETPRANVDMVDVRTWSFTFVREVLKNFWDDRYGPPYAAGNYLCIHVFHHNRKMES